MRKIIFGFAFIAVAGLIAWAVRAQLHDDDRDTGARAPASEQPLQPTPQAPQEKPSAQPVMQTVSQNVPPQTDGNSPGEERPVISRDIPTIAEEPEDAQQAATMLKRASTAYTNMKSMRANFVQRRENPLLGSSIVSRGRLFQRKPDRFLLKFTEPDGDVIVSDGRYFWLYYPSVDAKQVLRSPASEEGAGAVDLQAQFIGDPLRRFTHKYEGRETFNGRNTHVLTLTPRDKDAGYRTLKVWIDAQDHLVRRFLITEQTGALVEFQLTNLVVNPNLPDEIFRFTPPAGARVVER
jgi:outer membrane lipoprotein carrier protein